MARHQYEIKQKDNDTCFVLFPITQTGRATRTSIQSIRTQLEKLDKESLVQDIRLDSFAGMQRITIRTSENDGKGLFSDELLVGQLIEQLRSIEAWLADKSDSKMTVRLDGQHIMFDKTDMEVIQV